MHHTCDVNEVLFLAGGTCLEAVLLVKGWWAAQKPQDLTNGPRKYTFYSSHSSTDQECSPATAAIARRANVVSVASRAATVMPPLTTFPDLVETLACSSHILDQSSNEGWALSQLGAVTDQIKWRMRLRVCDFTINVRSAISTSLR